MGTWREHFWLWGQDPGSHHFSHNPFLLPGVNKMDSAEGGKYFGIPNCCRVAMTLGPVPPFDAESEKLKDFKQVVWSAIGAGGVARNDNDQSDLDEVLRQAARYPNVTGAVLDDFFLSMEQFRQDGRIARHTVQSIAAMRDRLHGFPQRRLDLWMVWYTWQLDFPVADYIALCDVVTMWTWKGSDLAKLDENFESFERQTQGKRRLAGCYMYNYGERMPLPLDQMKFQLDRYERWMHAGRIEGIVFCSNCIADIGLGTVEQARQWIDKVGERPCVSV